ncbi:MAG TPA: hypothetical protein VKY31_02905, partial [Terriglobia bacterium]|nr:hypothetical protein [Terriglobia bacterium]
MDPDEQVVLKEYPLLFWLLGILCLFIAGALIDEVSGRIIFGLLGLAAITLCSILTVTVDRRRGILNLHYRSLLRAWTKSYEISDVSA